MGRHLKVFLFLTGIWTTCFVQSAAFCLKADSEIRGEQEDEIWKQQSYAGFFIVIYSYGMG